MDTGKKIIKRAHSVDSDPTLQAASDQNKRFNKLETTIERMSVQLAQVLDKDCCSPKQSEQRMAEKESDQNEAVKGNLLGIFNVHEVEKKTVYSKSIRLAGEKWKLEVNKIDSNEKESGLCVSLFCTDNLPHIYFDVFYSFRLLGLSEDVCEERYTYFQNVVQVEKDNDNKGSECDNFIAWSKLVNPGNGFIDEKKNFVITAEISVRSKWNTERPLDAAFLSSGFVESDCTLLVEGLQIPVSKGLLSTYSDYFKVMFHGPFSEKDKDEIELKNVKAEDFLYLLEAIYPSVGSAKRPKELFGRNAEVMLRMASFYQVKFVTKQCVDYLKNCPVTEVPMERKLVLAQNFDISELMDHCVANIKTLKDVKKLRSTLQFSLLDMEIKNRIYENIF